MPSPERRARKSGVKTCSALVRSRARATRALTPPPGAAPRAVSAAWGRSDLGGKRPLPGPHESFVLCHKTLDFRDRKEYDQGMAQPYNTTTRILVQLTDLRLSEDWSDEALELVRAAEAALHALTDMLIGPECRACGITIETRPTGRPRLYCSDSCRQAAHRALTP